MLEVTETNFNIRSNGSAMMKTEDGMMQQNLTILPKLLRISTLVILKSPGPGNLRLAKIRGKEVDNQELFLLFASGTLRLNKEVI